MTIPRKSHPTKTSPSIAIAVPHYEQTQYLERCLLSVWWQMGPRDELIVIDDATPGWRRAAPQLCAALPRGPAWRRVTFIQHRQNTGVSATRNEAARRARKEWLLFLDADDLLAPFALTVYRAYASQCADTVQVITGSMMRECDERLTGIWEGAGTALAAMKLANPIGLSASLIRRCGFRATPGFDERIRFEEDWDFWLKIQERFGAEAFLVIPELVCYYHINAQERRAKKAKHNYTVAGLNVREYFRQRYGCTPRHDAPDPGY